MNKKQKKCLTINVEHGKIFKSPQQKTNRF